MVDGSFPERNETSNENPDPTSHVNGADRYDEVMAEINRADEAIEESTWALGLRLLRAQEEFGTKKWTAMFDRRAAQHLRFGLRRGQMLVRIVKDERLRELARRALLPDEITVQDALTRVPDAILWAAADDGRLHRDMGCAEAENLSADPIGDLIRAHRKMTDNWNDRLLRPAMHRLLGDYDARIHEVRAQEGRELEEVAQKFVGDLQRCFAHMERARAERLGLEPDLSAIRDEDRLVRELRAEHAERRAVSDANLTEEARRAVVAYEALHGPVHPHEALARMRYCDTYVGPFGRAITYRWFTESHGAPCPTCGRPA